MRPKDSPVLRRIRDPCPPKPIAGHLLDGFFYSASGEVEGVVACLLNAVGAEDCRESGERAAACREVVARCDHPARRSAGGVEEGVGEASRVEGQVGEVL